MQLATLVIEAKTESIKRGTLDIDKMRDAGAKAEQGLKSSFAGVDSSFKKTEQSAKGVEQSVDKMGKSAKGSGDTIKGSSDQAAAAYKRLRASLDPVYANSLRYEAAVNQIQQAVKSGVTTQMQANRVLSLASKEYLAVAASASTASTATSSVAQVSAGAASSINFLAVAAKAFVAIQVAKTAFNMAASMAQASDAAIMLTGRVEALTGSAQRGQQALADAFDISKEIGIGIKGIGDMTGRFTLATQQIGYTQAQVSSLTDTVLKLGVIGGASTQELQSGSIQLGQGLASGVLQGEELRSVLENMPLVAREIAEELTVGIGALRQMAADGEVTADIVGRALLNAADDASKEFEGLPLTVERASGQMAAAWTEFTVEIDNSIGASQLLASSLLGVASIIENITNKNGDIKKFNDEFVRLNELDLKSALDRSTGAVVNFKKELQSIEDNGSWINEVKVDQINDKIKEGQDKVRLLSKALFEVGGEFGGVSGSNTVGGATVYQIDAARAKAQYDIVASVKDQAPERARILSLSQDQLNIEKTIADYRKKFGSGASDETLKLLDAEAKKIAEIENLKSRAAVLDKKASQASLKASREAAKAAREQLRDQKRQNNAYQSLLQGAIYDAAPWVKLEDEARELELALEAVGAKFGAFEKRQIEITIDETKLNAQLAKINFYGPTSQEAKEQQKFLEDRADDLQKAAEETFEQWRDLGRSAFEDIFLSGEDGLKSFGESLLKTFTGIGLENISDSFASLATIASNDNGIDAGKIEDSVAQGSFNGVQAGIGALLQAGGMSQKGAGQYAGAATAGLGGAAAAYSAGASSGSPVIGALGGAVSGASSAIAIGASLGTSAGPIGIAAGAIIGAAIGALGGSGGGPNRKDQLKDFRAQSTQKLEESRGALQNFTDTLSGIPIGNLTESIREIDDQTSQYIKLLMDAGGTANSEEMEKVWAARNQFLVREYQTLQDNFGGQMASLSAGMGLDSPMKAANDNMAQASDGIQKYIKEIEILNERVGQTAKTEEMIAQIRLSGADYLTSLMTGSEGLSEMEISLQKIDGSASGLDDALIKLGYSMDSAAAIAGNAAKEATQQLQDGFTSGLQQQINALTDRGYVNEFMALSETFEVLQKDVGALGVGADEVAKVMRLRAGEIAVDAGLTSAALQDVIMQFPQLAAVLGDLDVVLLGASLQGSSRAAATALRDATSREIEALQFNLTSSQDKVNLYNSISDALTRAYTDRRVLSEMGERNQLSNASEFLRSALAAGGTDDLDALQNALSVVADPSTSLFKSFAEYQQDFNINTNVIDSLKDITEGQLTVEEKMLEGIENQIVELETTRDMHLEALDNQLSALLGIDNKILTLAEAISGVQQIQSLIDEQKNTPTLNVANNTDQFKNQLDEIYQQYLGRDAEQGGLDYYRQQNASGLSLSEISRLVAESDEAARRNAPGFANGGNHTGGWRMVGERGPELERTGASRIFSNSDTQKMFDSKSIVEQLKELNSRIRDLQKDSKTETRIMNDWNTNGLPVERTA